MKLIPRIKRYGIKPCMGVPTQHHSVFRYHRDGFLRVDGGERVTGQSLGSLRTLNAGELTYLGGIESESGDDRGEKLKSRVGTSSGFVGCLRDFKLGRRPVALHSDHDPTVMVRIIASLATILLWCSQFCIFAWFYLHS